jgi:hypothetical protein
MLADRRAASLMLAEDELCGPGVHVRRRIFDEAIISRLLRAGDLVIAVDRAYYDSCAPATARPRYARSWCDQERRSSGYRRPSAPARAAHRAGPRRRRRARRVIGLALPSAAQDRARGLRRAVAAPRALHRPAARWRARLPVQELIDRGSGELRRRLQGWMEIDSFDDAAPGRDPLEAGGGSR